MLRLTPTLQRNASSLVAWGPGPYLCDVWLIGSLKLSIITTEKYEMTKMTLFESSQAMPVSKQAAQRLTLADDVNTWLLAGNSIKQLRSRARRRYVNPVPLSPITLARCQMEAARKAGAKRVAHLFPSSVDPDVARALTRGRGYGRRRIGSNPLS